MENSELTLKEIETARFNFSSSFGKLIYDSGSIVLRKPELNTSITGLYYQTARDCSVIII